MFERFTTQARQAVVLALAEAQDLGAGQIGCDHLLIGVAHGRSGAAADALADAGLDLTRLRQLAQQQPAAEPLDADALAMLGIDLAEVRRATEAAFGPGALDRPRPRLTPVIPRVRMAGEAKRAIELALRTAHRTHSKAVTADHLLIGIIDQGDNGALRMLAAADTDPAALRADIVRRMTAAA